MVLPPQRSSLNSIDVGDEWAKQHGIALFNALSTGRTVSQTPDLEGLDSTGAVFDLRFSSGNGNLALVKQ